MTNQIFTRLKGGVFDPQERVIAFNFADDQGATITLKISEEAFQQLFLQLVSLAGQFERTRTGSKFAVLTPNSLAAEKMDNRLVSLEFQFPQGGVVRMAVPTQARPILEHAVDLIKELEADR
jgi:hypothetical protein